MHLLLGRRRIETTALALFLGLALLGGSAFGQAYRDREGGKVFRDGPHVGFATGGDVRNEDFAFGYQASYEVNEFFSVELAVTRQTDEIQDRVDRFAIPVGFNIDMEIYAIALTGRLFVRPVDALTLYAGGGVGFYIMKTDAQEVRVLAAAAQGGGDLPRPATLLNLNVDADNDFGVHAAVGCEIELNENWELFAEYRHVSLDSEANLEVTEQTTAPEDSGAPFIRTTHVLNDTLQYDHGLVRVGLNYRF